jgi:hypothetical protein
VKIPRGSKKVLQKCHFWLKNSKFSSKMAFFAVHFTKILSPLKLKGPEKNFGGPHVALGPHFGLV